MKEKPPLLYDVVYPKDFTSKIKKTGKYDVLDLARKGMVICFEILQPKELVDKALKEVAGLCWNPNYENGIILFDIDEWVDNANKAFKFVKETGHFGELPLNLFEGTQHLTDVLSIDKQKELDKKEDRRPTGGYIAKPIQIKNDIAEKKGLEHWLLFISTHDYLVEGYFLNTLIEIHSKNFHNLMDKTKSKEKKKKIKKQKSKDDIKIIVSKQKEAPKIGISKGDIPLISPSEVDKKSSKVAKNWNKFRLRNL